MHLWLVTRTNVVTFITMSKPSTFLVVPQLLKFCLNYKKQMPPSSGQCLQQLRAAPASCSPPLCGPWGELRPCFPWLPLVPWEGLLVRSLLTLLFSAANSAKQSCCLLLSGRTWIPLKRRMGGFGIIDQSN